MRVREWNQAQAMWAGLALAFAIVTTGAVDAQKSFDFKDPKGVNNVTFVLDSELEPIMGVASGITGSINFDPKDPKKTTGKITIAAEGIHVSNGRMKSKMHKEEWLDVAQHPTVTFEIKKVLSAKPGKSKSGAAVMDLRVAGDFTIKGVTKSVEVTIAASHLPNRLGDRQRSPSGGDLLVLRSEFVLKRSDFGVGKPMATVADDMEIRVAIVGASPNK